MSVCIYIYINACLQRSAKYTRSFNQMNSLTFAQHGIYRLGTWGNVGMTMAGEGGGA